MVSFLYIFQYEEKNKQKTITNENIKQYKNKQENEEKKIYILKRENCIFGGQSEILQI